MTTALLAVTVGSLALRPLLSEAVRVAALISLTLFVVGGEFGLHRVSLPHRRAQVPTAVIGTGSRRGALQFGYEMGTGMRTHMPSNLPYLPLAAALLVTTWVQALLVGLGFGLGRAWMALGRHYSNDVDWWDSRWQENERWLRRLLAVAMTVLLAMVLATATRG